MPRIAASRLMPLSPDVLWSAIAGLETHPRWMKDARSMVFVGEQRRGKGTKMKVETVLGPLRTTDVMEVVDWSEGDSIEVSHQGLVQGRGRLSLTVRSDGTLVTWEEELIFPWWLGDGVTAWLAWPFLAATWRENLRRLEQTLNSP